ncbi:cyanidin 3-O-galactoside 2''-O-xylosyltransferase FGGT1-like [Nicotiana sylvestris]|uniref:cyanidin 3-O-galactoside 2''-O-xylosyltransferase FGGT1-like n=1 Tax=Nicotiana sylvestris TaxID=4096 RepID=UPI00388C38E3
MDAAGEDSDKSVNAPSRNYVRDAKAMAATPIGRRELYETFLPRGGDSFHGDAQAEEDEVRQQRGWIKEDKMENKKLTFIMYPWYAMGHLTSFLHLSNKLADRGHTIFFIHPTNTLSKLEKFNLYPQLINFISVTVPHVKGLPIGAETTSDIPIFKQNLLWQALDLTEQKIESLIQELKPHFILYDFACWGPLVARKYGVKSIHYCSNTPSSVGYLMRGENLTPEDEMMEPPLGFPLNSSIKLHKYEARLIAALHSIGKESSGSG